MNSAPSEALPFQHSAAFRRRRFVNWFPMGLTYALLYMGRYNLTVASVALGAALTKEDFGLIFGAGTAVYSVAFLLNGPATDKLGGRRAMLAASLGAAVMNLLIGLFVYSFLRHPSSVPLPIVPTMSVLYAANMYFQSFGAVAIVKVNAHWFHVRERGGFSGIFGTMISSGIFLAFTINGWILSLTKDLSSTGQQAPWFVFFGPAGLLLLMFAVELFLLKDRPSTAGLDDFDTGDASSGDHATAVSVFRIIGKIVTNPIVLTVAFVELCTGVLRNGVMHWFPFYAKEVWALPQKHWLRDGSWGSWHVVGGMFALAAVFFLLAGRSSGRRRAWLVISGAMIALAPFFQGGWGGLLFVAGVVGGNVAGWVSDLFFQSRRAPAAAGLYAALALCSLAMVFALGDTGTKVGWVDPKLPFQPGDDVLSVHQTSEFRHWSDIGRAIACIPSACEGQDIRWDTKRCMCSRSPEATSSSLDLSDGSIEFRVLRNGTAMQLSVEDPKRIARAGDSRTLAFGPELTLSPVFLGLIVFLMSLCVIGTHGLLSGTATMDFGGRKAAATAVGLIDGFVYVGTTIQSVCLGYLTTRNWSYWPLFLLPFSVIGFVLLTRIWNAKPRPSGVGH